MAALLIDRLLRSEHEAQRPVTFIYCNYKRQSEQSSKHILSSILRQIVNIQRGVPQVVQDFYATCKAKDITPSNTEIEQILVAVSKEILGLTIVIDALDECEAPTCRDFLSTVESLRKQCKIRFLATSRFLPNVQSHTTFLGKPSLEVRASDQDVEKYVKSRVSDFRSPVASKTELLQNLVSSIVSATEGM